MPTGHSCDARFFRYWGKVYERQRVWRRCPECSAGWFCHYFGCSREKCPICGKKLISCKHKKAVEKAVQQYGKS